jgi:hypothetical protein
MLLISAKHSMSGMNFYNPLQTCTKLPENALLSETQNVSLRCLHLFSIKHEICILHKILSKYEIKDEMLGVFGIYGSNKK